MHEDIYVCSWVGACQHSHGWQVLFVFIIDVLCLLFLSTGHQPLVKRTITTREPCPAKWLCPSKAIKMNHIDMDKKEAIKRQHSKKTKTNAWYPAADTPYIITKQKNSAAVPLCLWHVGFITSEAGQCCSSAAEPMALCGLPSKTLD